MGISLERGRPGCPQDNGAHERMHRDVRRELQAGRIGRDQAAFDLWREEYNHERPHEALGMKTPAEIYRASDRRYTGTPDDLDYGGMTTRRVNERQGYISHGGEMVSISSALGGWSVGLCPCQDSDFLEVWFSRLLVGHLDEKTASFRPINRGGPKTGQPEPEVTP